MAAAFSLAQTMKDTDIIVIQETEYTGAGKHLLPQLSFARRNGVEIKFGNPLEEIPGKNIIFPKDGSYLKHQSIDINELKKTYLKIYKNIELTTEDYKYLCEELSLDINEVKDLMQ